jgi:hypothetical protein
MSHIDTNYSDDDVILLSEDDGFTFEQIHTWKPARVLGPRQVAVDVPPVEEWRDSAKEMWLAWCDVTDEHSQPFVITRAEAERMEASDDSV